jgi:ankyrin repeat protein
MKNVFNRNEKPDQAGIDAFIAAARNNDMNGVNSFLERYGDQYINEKDNTGNTALIRAAFGNCADTVKLLLGRGARIDEKNDTGNTAMFLAERYGLTGITEIIQSAEMQRRIEEDVAAVYRGITEDIHVQPILLRKKIAHARPS